MTCTICNRTRDERDALAARLAAVEALADKWEREAREQSIVGGESPRPADYSEGYYVGTMRARAAHAAHLRAALTTNPQEAPREH